MSPRFTGPCPPQPRLMGAQAGETPALLWGRLHTAHKAREVFLRRAADTKPPFSTGERRAHVENPPRAEGLAQRPANIDTMQRAISSTISPIVTLCLAVGALVSHVVAAQPKVAAPNSDYSVSVVPGTVRQGDFFMLRVSARSAVAEISASCQWMKKAYVLQPVAGSLESILPVPMTAPAGKATVRATIDSPTGRASASAAVRIVKRRFGIQRLTMQKETLALYSGPGVEEEYRAIRTALSIESPDRPWQPPFIRPCGGTTGTSFGVHRITNRTSRSRHRGVDIRAPEGTPVVAANSGVVTLAREDFALHGRTVVIDHGQGLSSLYLHLASIAVAEGQSVQRGETIGTVGASGASTGAHLHWAFYIHDACVDPFAVIRFPWPAPPP